MTYYSDAKVTFCCRETTLAVHRHIMDVNYFGHVAVTQALIDAIPKGGTVVAVGSVQGRIAVPYRSSYSASKHAMQVLQHRYWDNFFCVILEFIKSLQASKPILINHDLSCIISIKLIKSFR